MKRILIYDTTISGHHMEYLHHIYMATEGVDAEFVLAIPEEFKNVKNKLEWPERNNVSFDLISRKQLTSLNGGWLFSRLKRARLCSQYVKKHKIDDIFFLELIIQFPFLPIMLPKGVKVSGILYQLIPYEWPRLSCISKIKCGLEVWSYAKNKCVIAPMILNDLSCASYYNRFFHTEKFVSIVDPAMPLNYNPQNRRSEFDMSDDDKMILHFGAMNTRKGTILLLEAASQMSKEQLNDKVFVFAGKIGSDIKDKFYSLMDSLKIRGVRIYVFDEFCSYERLADLCYSCDCIVVPYRNYSYSSGLIGYSAQFNKTVIGPSQGILGKLIRRNGLGLTFSEMTPSCIAQVLSSPNCYLRRENRYAEIENVQSFTNTIMSTIM